MDVEDDERGLLTNCVHLDTARFDDVPWLVLILRDGTVDVGAERNILEQANNSRHGYYTH